MGARGELFTTQVLLDNRAYFFNVKENRAGDIFLQIVESKSRDGEDFDRHQVAIFAEDMQRFLQGLDKSLSFIDKARVERMRLEREKRPLRDSRDRARGNPVRGSTDTDTDVGQDEEKERLASGVKRTGKVIHIISKRSPVASCNLSTVESSKQTDTDAGTADTNTTAAIGATAAANSSDT